MYSSSPNHEEATLKITGSAVYLFNNEIRSDNGKQSLPINPFVTVAYAFIDNLSPVYFSDRSWLQYIS